MKYFVGDIETNAIHLKEIDRIHCFSLSSQNKNGKWVVNTTTDHDKMRKVLLDPNVCIVGHNFVQYDIPALEKILKIKVKCKVIDTLGISWTLFPKRIIGTHGLGDWGEEFGVPKVKVEDNEWEGIGKDKEDIISYYESLPLTLFEKSLGSYTRQYLVSSINLESFKKLSPQDQKKTYELYKKEQLEFNSLMESRATEDVKINTNLWLLILKKLKSIYGEDDMETAYKWMDYVTFKMDCLKEQAEVGLRIDRDKVEKTLKVFNKLKEEKVNILKGIMPPNPVYSVKKIPKVMYRKDESLSSNGEKWLAFLEEQGLPIDHTEEVRYISGYEDAKPTSPDQVKDWLYSYGWKPETFKENEKFMPKVMKKKDGSVSAQAEKWYELLKENGLPKTHTGGVPYKTAQIKNAKGNLCKSVIKLADKIPQVHEYVDLGVYRHRIGLLKSFLINSDAETGFTVAGASCFTNTLRLQHRKPVANLNKVTGDHNEEEGNICWKDGVHIRQNIVAHHGHILAGSDLSSLENRLALNFMYPYDPDYVDTKNAPGYDSHLGFAVFAGALTQQQADDHIAGKENYSKIRGIYKTGNYALQYFCGTNTLAKNTGLTQREAKKVKDAYWVLNKSIIDCSDNLTVKIVKNSKGEKEMWVKNLVNNYYYSLRTEKDKFSTLCQSSASYILDLYIMLMRKRNWVISHQYHDEWLLNLKDTPENRKRLQNDLDWAINTINNKFDFYIKMGADVEFGESYASVH